MFFQRGKKKGTSAFEVLDVRSNKKVRVTVPAPNSGSGTVSKTEESEGQSFIREVQDELEAIDNFPADEDLSDCDSDIELRTARSYKKRKERLCSNWDRIRLQLIRTSLASEGFLPSACNTSACSNPVKTRCRDCGFSTYYCQECCDIIHRDKLQFHACEIFEVSL